MALCASSKPAGLYGFLLAGAVVLCVHAFPGTIHAPLTHCGGERLGRKAPLYRRSWTYSSPTLMLKDPTASRIISTHAMSGMKQQQVPCASGCSSPKRRSVFHQPFRVVAAVAALAACLPAFAAQSSALASTASPIDKLSGSGFLQAFSLIFVSEIGDKTFFIAGLLAMRSSKVLAFVGSLAALAVMTIISVVIGQIFHAVPSSISRGIPFDDYLAVAAFAFFGVKTLKQAYEMQDEGAGMEVEKAEAEREVDGLGSGKVVKLKTSWTLLVQAFTLVFAAEIGDRSFLSTIALSAALNPFSVAAGAIAAHAAATGIAVAGGALMSRFLSERTMGYIGGSLFIVFAITTALGLF